MGSLPYVESYRDLIVYQKARVLMKEIFEVSKSFPREETLIDQPDTPIIPLDRHSDR